MSETLDGLPPQSLERHVAFLSTSDAGKTYAMKGETERLMDAGERFVALDPTGVWWGLRLLTDGKTPSPYRPVIIGGLHADIPFDAGMGERLATLVSDGDFSLIVDLQQATVADRTRFATEFCEAMLRRSDRRPLHLILDEAHQFAPKAQRMDPQSARMLNAVNNLVSGGRGIGLRVALLTQRPAKLHNDSLSQVQTLVAMFTMAPHDRTAIAAWIKDNADPNQGAEILSSLGTLPVGHGWIYAPRLGILDRVHFRALKTFDSSATPTSAAAAAEAARARLGPLDLAALRIALTPAEGSAPPATSIVDDGGRLEGFEAGKRDGAKWAISVAMDAFRDAVDSIDVDDLLALSLRSGPPVEIPARVPATASDAMDAIIKNRFALELIKAAQRAPVQLSAWSDAAILMGAMPTGGQFNAAVAALRTAEFTRPPENTFFFPGNNDFTGLIQKLAQKFAGKAAAGRIFIHIAMVGPRNQAEIAHQLGMTPRGGQWNTAWAALRKSPLMVDRAGVFDIAPILRELQKASKV